MLFPISIRLCSRVGLTVCAGFATVAAGQAPGTDTAFVTRGRQIEKQQQALSALVKAFHASLDSVVRRDAPDLLPKLEPPAPIATGYQLLPRITSPAFAPAPAAKLQIVSYSWAWTASLLRNEADTLGALEMRLHALREPPRPALDSLVDAYRALVDRKRRVDADVNYNWLWQREIVRVPRIFERATRLQAAIIEHDELRALVDRAKDSTGSAQRISVTPALDSAIDVRARYIERELGAGIRRVDVPAYVKFVQDSMTSWRIVVPLYTDITDTAFLSAFARAVSSEWRGLAGGTTYRVEVDMRRVQPSALYCATRDVACVGPARGATIDLGGHIARFPSDGAVLTTGGGTIHVTAGRALVLSPHDVTARLLSHEFGHLLGFADAYLRGFRHAGADGFVITELVVDHDDLMGNSRDGGVRSHHFERLMRGRDVPVKMQAGLDAMYVRRQPASAVEEFRAVLRIQPDHYGAVYQIAKALDATGRRDEARDYWERVLVMAGDAGDVATAAEARVRLEARRPR